MTPDTAMPQLLPVADVHVVMNAMNRLAARTLAQGREEDPLLFALADYLRATLSTSASSRLGLAQEVEALAALVVLEQEISGARIELRTARPLPQVRVPRGMLLAAAAALLRARRPKSGGAWRLALAWTAVGPGWTVALSLEGLAAGAECDGRQALEQVQAALEGLGSQAVLGLRMESPAVASLSLALDASLVAAA